jgi:hypothetical protein
LPAFPQPRKRSFWNQSNYENSLSLRDSYYHRVLELISQTRAPRAFLLLLPLVRPCAELCIDVQHFVPFWHTPTALRNFTLLAKWHYTEFEKQVNGFPKSWRGVRTK